MSDIIKEEQHFQEENLHTEVVTVTTASKNLEDILAELKPTIEFDDGISSGTLSLDHSTIKTEAAGYKSSSYTVTATKNYTGLDRNDSSYIDKTVEKNGRTLSLSNVTWSVERTALVAMNSFPPPIPQSLLIPALPAPLSQPDTLRPLSTKAPSSLPASPASFIP